MAGAGNDRGTRSSLRASFPSTPVESRVGESYTEESCWVTEFVCEVDEYYRSACEALDYYGEHEDKCYCVLHYPGEEKQDDFRKVIESKLARKDYDFGGATFPEGSADFVAGEFDASANFTGATFFGEANFSGAQFSGETTMVQRFQSLHRLYLPNLPRTSQKPSSPVR